jgi:hypothetical protein
VAVALYLVSYGVGVWRVNSAQSVALAADVQHTARGASVVDAPEPER